MTDYELTVVQGAVRHALDVGAPGLSDTIKTAIIIGVARRLRHQLNIPSPGPEAAA